MIDPLVTRLIGLAAILILDLSLAAAQSSLTHATLPRLIALQDSRDSRTTQLLISSAFPRAAVHLTQFLARFLLAGLVLIWFWIDRPISSDWQWAFLILLAAALVLAWLEWLIGERIAKHPEEWIIRLAPGLRALTWALTPLLAITLGLHSLRIEAEPVSSSVTEDELKILVDAGQQEGVLEKDEREMIYSIFRLGDTLAREIMIPRIDITALEVQTPIPQAVDSLLQSGYSRLPVYEETVDNIKGLLYTKDLLRVWRENQIDKSLRDLLRPAYFIPEAKKVDELLAEMQSQRIHMAMVVDEYGGIAGLVTLEDIVEEIVGEIQDEFDQSEESPYVQVGEGEFIFQGRIDLNDFNEVMAASLPEEEADTLGGFIYNRLGRVPVSQEVIQVEDLLLTVEQVIGRRIRKVRARRVPTAQDPDQKRADDHVE